MNATSLINQTAQKEPPSTMDRVGSTALGKDEFVKLLLAQLGNQDPTQPVDSQAFVAQLAQFASLEQLNSVNERLDSLLLAATSSSQTAAASFVGRDVQFRTDKLQLGAAGGPVSSSGKLTADATEVSVSVVDSTGKPVRTLQLGARAKGDFAFVWDGNLDSGATAPAGEYKLKVSAVDKDKKPVTADMYGLGLCTGVAFDSGYPELLVNGSRIKMSEIVEIQQRSGT